MLSCCLKCRENTGSKNPKVVKTKNGEIMLLSKCEVCDGKKSKFVKKQEVRRATCYSDRLHDFSVTIPRCYKDVYINSFFPRTARLWNSLPIVCFPLTYDVNGFKSRIRRHLLTVGSF